MDPNGRRRWCSNVPGANHSVLAAAAVAFMCQGVHSLTPMAAIPGMQSLAAGGSEGTAFRSAAAAIALLGVVAADWVEAVSMVSLAGIFVAMAMAAGGALAGERPVFVLGIPAAALSLGNFGLQAVRWHTGYAWVALALLGIGVIFGASLIEKGRTRPFINGYFWVDTN